MKLRSRSPSAVLMLTLAVILSSPPSQAVESPKRFQIDSYSVDVPASWTYKLQPVPDGTKLHMFMGPQRNGALPYCHTTQQAVNTALAPGMAKMNAKERLEFFTRSSDQNLLFSLYDNLASAQGFRLIHTNAVAIATTFPAFTADFVFRTPEGFVYRVRSHYTFWNKAQLSIWCQTTSRTEAAADAEFLNNLATFQQFIASVKITP